MIESREAKLDRRDIDVVRTSPSVPGCERPRAFHAVGAAEPLLWVADGVCGAEGERLSYNDASYVAALAPDHESLSTAGA